MLQTHFHNEWAGMPCNTYAEHVTAALETASKGGGFIKLPKMLLVAFQLTTCVENPQPVFFGKCVPFRLTSALSLDYNVLCTHVRMIVSFCICKRNFNWKIQQVQSATSTTCM